MKYHISPDGKPRVCQAKEKVCAYGGLHGSLEDIERGIAQSFEIAPAMKSPDRYFSDFRYPDSFSEDEIDFYRPYVEMHGGFAYEGRFFIPGAPGASTFICFTCGMRPEKKAIHREVVWEEPCAYCGDMLRDGLTGVTLKYEDHELFDPNKVFEREWYHFSRNENWDIYATSEEADSILHLGSFDAAVDRKTQTKYGAKGHLWRIKLSPSSEISSKIIEDDPFNNDDEASTIDGEREKKGVLLAGITRYMNLYEDPGSISLMVNPKTIASVSYGGEL